MFRKMLLVGTVLSVLLLSPAVTIAANAPCGAAKGLIDPNCDLKTNLEKIYPISVRIIVFLAFLAVIMAGYTYITSFGQPARIEEAKNWLIAAVTGVALILLVPVIISFLESIQLPGGTSSSSSSSAPPTTQTPNVQDGNTTTCGIASC